MRTFLFIFLLYLCGTAQVNAQNMDFSGTWTGILTQAAGGLSDIYEFSLTIQQDKNGNLSGTSKIRISEAGDYGVLSLKGKAEALNVTIYEIKVVEQNIRTEAYWCIKYYSLRYDAINESLSGNWGTTSVGCPTGTIELVRATKPKNQENTAKRNIKTEKETLKHDDKSTSKVINTEPVKSVTKKVDEKDKDLPPDYMSMEKLKSELKENKSVTGKKVILESIYFKQSSIQMIGDSQKNLLEIIKFLQENPSIHIKINGHTDNVGKDFSNLQLSRLRATVIMNFLINKGINAKRLSSEGYGGNLPLRPNNTEENKKKNRRVEFEIL